MQVVDVPGWSSDCKTGTLRRRCVEPMTIWPFNLFGKTRPGSARTIGTIYGMIVAQARKPEFYRDFKVPDTVEGRFDLVVLHLWMVVRRLSSEPEGAKLAQGLFDHFCEDMDANLREMGVGDLTVPKRMQAFGEAFYGRSVAYDGAFAEGKDALARALCKNVFSGREPDQATRLAGYVMSSIAQLAQSDIAAITAGRMQFAPFSAQEA